MFPGEKETKHAYELGDGRTDQGFVKMFGDNINLIDLRQQSSGQGDEPIGIPFDGRARTDEGTLLSRESMQHLQNQNLMDL